MHIAIARSNYLAIFVPVKEKLSYVCTEMAFICIAWAYFVSQRHRLVQQLVPGIGEEVRDKLTTLRIEALPYVCKTCLTYVSYNNSTAKAAEDVSIRVDMYALCGKKGRSAS